MFERSLEKKIESQWDSGKIIIVLGPRQVGKTTLLESICRQHGDFLFINGDEIPNQQLFANVTESLLRQMVGRNHTVFIDEAQKITNVGQALKILHDRIPEVRVLVSGSLALEIGNRINEPLTGRKWEYQMFPISFCELQQSLGFIEAGNQLEQCLIFGMYPEILTNRGNEEALLRQLSSSYLYKDLLTYQQIRKPEVLNRLLIALAHQIGSEVSYNELAQLVGVDRNTVEQYIQLLEKAFVVFRLSAFSRNNRKEISKGKKIYFYDTGVRNALINNFTPLHLRNDIGALWENFLITERMKTMHYADHFANTYFWRTTQQQEIDYIEEKNGQMEAFEFKWNAKTKVKFPKTFINEYQPVKTDFINRENFRDFVCMTP